jgi:hypothetical protein
VNRIALSRFGQILARRYFSASKNILWTNPFPKMTKMLLTCWLGRVSHSRILLEVCRFWTCQKKQCSTFNSRVGERRRKRVAKDQGPLILAGRRAPRTADAPATSSTDRRRSKAQMMRGTSFSLGDLQAGSRDRFRSVQTRRNDSQNLVSRS